MTMPISGSFNVNVPFAAQPSPPIYPPPVPNMCFLCARKGNDPINIAPMNMAITVYKGTYLCRHCVQSLPDDLLINEFPPNV